MSHELSQQITKIVQLIHIIAGLVEIAAQIFLITVISRSKNLRTKTNVSLLNLTVVGALYYSISVTFALLNTFVALRWVHQALFYCLESAMLVLYIMFATLMALDWFLTGFKPRVGRRYRKFEKHVYYFIYLSGILNFTISMFFSKTHLSIVLLVPNVVYAALVVLLITFNVLKRKLTPETDNSSTEYSFVVSNIVIFSMLPCLIANVLIIYIFQLPFVTFCFTLYVSWLAHSLVILWQLGASDKDFKEAYKTILRKRKKVTEDDGNVIRNSGNDRQCETVA